MWQQVADNIHAVDEKFAVFDADVHVRAEDQQTLGEFLHVLLDAHVALLRGDLLRHPGGNGMRAGGDDLQVVLASKFHDHASQSYQFGSKLSRCLAYVGTDLDHGLVTLGLDLLTYDEPSL